jgi:hypothetical protein
LPQQLFVVRHLLSNYQKPLKTKSDKKYLDGDMAAWISTGSGHNYSLTQRLRLGTFVATFVANFVEKRANSAKVTTKAAIPISKRAGIRASLRRLLQHLESALTRTQYIVEYY